MKKIKNYDEYISLKYVYQDEVFKSLEDQLICSICNDIKKDPVICLSCQNSFCKKCLDEWIEKSNECVFHCKNSKFSNCTMVNNLLTKTKYYCKNNCGKIINYQDIKNHYDSNCPNKNKKTGELIQTKYQRIKRLDKEMIRNSKIEKGVSCFETFKSSAGVGKTSLFKNYLNKNYDGIKNQYESTISPNLGYITVELSDGAIFNFQIWDTAGQEVYNSLIKGYCRNAKGALIVYSVIDRNSFEKCNEYINMIREEADKNCVILVIGNKNDRENERKVSPSEGANFASNNHLIFFESSSFIENHVNNVFENLFELVGTTYKPNVNNNNINDTTIINLDNLREASTNFFNNCGNILTEKFSTIIPK